MEFDADFRTYEFDKDLDYIKEEQVHDVYSTHCLGGRGYRTNVHDRLAGGGHCCEELKEPEEDGKDKYFRDCSEDGGYLFEELEKLRDGMHHGNKTNRATSMLAKTWGFILK